MSPCSDSPRSHSAENLPDASVAVWLVDRPLEVRAAGEIRQRRTSATSRGLGAIDAPCTTQVPSSEGVDGLAAADAASGASGGPRTVEVRSTLQAAVAAKRRAPSLRGQGFVSYALSSLYRLYRPRCLRPTRVSYRIVEGPTLLQAPISTFGTYCSNKGDVRKDYTKLASSGGRAFSDSLVIAGRVWRGDRLKLQDNRCVEQEPPRLCQPLRSRS